MAQSLRAVWDTSSAQYTNDRGQTENLISHIYLPEDLTVAQLTSFINAMQGRVSPDAIPCALRGEGKPRYVEFVRQSGHVLKCPVYLRNDLIDTVKAGRDVLNGANANNRVVCIRLVGEHYANIYDDLVTSAAAPVAIPEVKPPAGAGKTRIMYSATMMEYKADSTPVYAANAIMPFRMVTDTYDSAPSNFAPVDDCLGNTDILNCGSKQVRTSRRYTPSFLTNNAALPKQSLTVPVASNVPAEIVDCGQNLANLAHVICLEYMGESNPRLDRSIT
ncbi:hypothetical protein [Spirulina sp. 06S082]|uniref:hypothetical protein n=1 Tax=Spirulina sp. 06S082 TaxID=3110248 RepID=UPI002B20CEEA|nr:hypothetical protein [Spirulina sp. 06S082]MEA5467991.1 hypothetical protein [Spirulina sp. 06S082]